MSSQAPFDQRRIDAERIPASGQFGYLYLAVRRAEARACGPLVGKLELNAGSSATAKTASKSLRIASASAEPSSAASAGVQTRRNRRPGRICAGQLPEKLVEKTS